MPSKSVYLVWRTLSSSGSIQHPPPPPNVSLLLPGLTRGRGALIELVRLQAASVAPAELEAMQRTCSVCLLLPGTTCLEGGGGAGHGGGGGGGKNLREL
jgi:hypothetical protein